MSEYLSRSAVAKAVAARIDRHELDAASFLATRDELADRGWSPESVAKMVEASEAAAANERAADTLHRLAYELGLSCGCCGHMMLDEDMTCAGDCTDRECGRHKR